MEQTSFNLDLDGLELLVVEDDPSSALMISHVLTAHGARVEAAADKAMYAAKRSGRNASSFFKRQ